MKFSFSHTQTLHREGVEAISDYGDDHDIPLGQYIQVHGVIIHTKQIYSICVQLYEVTLISTPTCFLCLLFVCLFVWFGWFFWLAGVGGSETLPSWELSTTYKEVLTAQSKR